MLTLYLRVIVPACAKIANNEIVKIECLDWTGGQIKNNDSADDVKNVDLTEIHYLSGPFDIETAEPGDVLVVEIQDVQPFQEQPWGFTGIFDRHNGGGFLDELYPKAYVCPPYLMNNFSFNLLQCESDLGFRRNLLLIAAHSACPLCGFDPSWNHGMCTFGGGPC